MVVIEVATVLALKIDTSSSGAFHRLRVLCGVSEGDDTSEGSCWRSLTLRNSSVFARPIQRHVPQRPRTWCPLTYRVFTSVHTYMVAARSFVLSHGSYEP